MKFPLHTCFPQQPQNLPLNALGPLGSQMSCPAPPQAPLRATPPPSAGAAGAGSTLPPLQTNQAGTPTPGPAQSTPPHTQPQTELPPLPQPHPGTPVSTRASASLLTSVYAYSQYFLLVVQTKPVIAFEVLIPFFPLSFRVLITAFPPRHRRRAPTCTRSTPCPSCPPRSSPKQSPNKKSRTFSPARRKPNLKWRWVSV